MLEEVTLSSLILSGLRSEFKIALSVSQGPDNLRLAYARVVFHWNVSLPSALKFCFFFNVRFVKRFQLILIINIEEYQKSFLTTITCNVFLFGEGCDAVIV